MASTITTTGTTTDPVSTQKLGGESTSSWVSRHNASVQASTPSSNTLTTTWKSTRGIQTKSTTRSTGESDAELLLRHVQEYVLAMLDEPPV